MDLIDRKRALEEMTFSSGIEQDCVLFVPLRDVNNHLKNLPSVQPERPKGHWIDTGSGQECSECGEVQHGYDSFRYYCAKCGSDNRGEQDEG